MGWPLVLAAVRVRLRVRPGDPAPAIVFTIVVLLICFTVGFVCLLAPVRVLRDKIGFGLAAVGNLIAGIAGLVPPAHQAKAVRAIGVVVLLVSSAVAQVAYTHFHGVLSDGPNSGAAAQIPAERLNEIHDLSGDVIDERLPAATPAPSPTPAPEARIDAMIAEASAQWRAGNAEGALAQARGALSLCNEHLGSAHPKTAQVQGMIDAAAKAAAAK